MPDEILDAATTPDSSTTESVPAPDAVVKTLLTDTKLPEADGEAQTDKKDAKPEDDGVPEKYELTVPEGFELDEALLAKFEPLAKGLGLSQTKAQQVADFFTEYKKSEVEKSQQNWAKQLSDWGTAARLDPEVGGAEFNANIKAAQTALSTYAPELVDVLNQTGLGNHPALVKAFVRIGKSMSEPSVRTGEAVPPPPPSRAEVMYPSMLPKT